MDSDAIKDFSDQDLLGELRRRGHVLSVWSVEDAKSAITDSDEGDDLDGAMLERAAEALLDGSSRSLEDILGSRGNEHLSDMWSLQRDEILQALAEPKA